MLLKLVVNEESNKVLFAETGKDFVDVLFSFLTFPLGTVTRLIQKESKEIIKEMLLWKSNFAMDLLKIVQL